MTSFNRTLMRVTASDLTARTDPQGVEKYVDGLNTDRPNVHDSQTKPESKPEKIIPSEMDMTRGIIIVHYNDGVPFSEINDMRLLIEGMGYRITSEKGNGKGYQINFEPCDLVA